MSELDVEVLSAIAKEVYRQVNPLLGTAKASEAMGRGAGGDETKYIDKLAEDIIISCLDEKGISCTLLSEECGVKEVGDPKKAAKSRLVVDSVDGTNNAIRGIPFASVSLAAAEGNSLYSLKSTVVADLVHGDLYSAERGEGTSLNGCRIKTTEGIPLSKAVVGIDLTAPREESFISGLARLIMATRHPRHFGSNALETCYVASGKLDAFVDLRSKLRITDMAGATLVVREAGGLLVDERGEELEVPLDSPTRRVSFIAASNRALLEEILGLL